MWGVRGEDAEEEDGLDAYRADDVERREDGYHGRIRGPEYHLPDLTLRYG